MITIKDNYAILTQLVIHAESISWNRLYNFLTCNAILLVAWATIYASEPDNPGLVAMALFCIVGAVSGIVWVELGRRGREYLRQYIEQATQLEELPNAFSPDIPPHLHAFQVDVKGPFYGQSRWILQKMPCAFAFLYVVLYSVTLLKFAI